MNYLSYGLLALGAAMIQFYYCYQVVRQRRRTRQRWANDGQGFAPNIASSADLADPANPYSSPGPNHPAAPAPARSRVPSKEDPNDVLGWLDQQQPKGQ